MKKIVTSTIIILSFFVYVFFYNKSQEVTSRTSTEDTPKPRSDMVSEITQFPTSVPKQQSFQPSSQSEQSGQAGQYKDGVYTGPAVDAFYGNIQVRATIQNGRLVGIDFLQYPNDHDESIEINTAAMPILKEEAIRSQSADVDSVTRATDSTEAFRVSLKAALQKAES